MVNSGGTNKQLWRKFNTSQIGKTKQNYLYDVKVTLQNISPELTSNQKFCQKCLILFSKKEDLCNHQRLFHQNMCLQKNNFKNNFKNGENSKIFNSYSNKLVFQNKCSKMNVMVNINDSKAINNNLSKPCFHCNIIFPSTQTLIDHLYEILYNKKSNILNPETLKFSSKCKFCDSNYNDVLSYNRHLRKRHRNEMLKSNNESMIKKTINEVRVMALKAILYKCSECNIHFMTSETAKNHLEHSELLQHWYCTNCQNFFKQEHKNLHEKQHNYSKYFTVVEVNNKSCYGTHLGEENSLNHQTNCNREQIEIDYRISDIVTEHNQEASQQKEDLKRSNNYHYSIIDTENFSSNMGDIKEKKCLNTSMEKYQQLYFCNVCKCNIPRNCNVEHHLEANCRRVTKNVCEYCGLVFSSETVDLHRIIHLENRNIQLQDFIIFDLKTKTKIRPVFDFPKCTLCEKYFICKNEIIPHVCNDGSSITCSVCNIKLTKSALQLHEPFHSYNTQNQIELNNKSDNLMLCNTDSSLTEITNNDQTSLSPLCSDSETECDDEVLHLYTCKNCDVSMNFYDEAVEHCHTHTHLNKIDMDTTKCAICNVNLISSTYDHHHQLHDTYSKERFQYLHFDVLLFNSRNDEWLGHVFGALPKHAINKIIKKSIYKYENKVKMQIVQDGPYELTMYKCYRCKSFIDCKSIYDHSGNCKVNSAKFYCKVCNIPFISDVFRIEHESIHNNLKVKLKSYRIVVFNRDQDKVINRNVSKMKYYVLFECRYCHVIVDKNTYNNHKCNLVNCKNCSICGLLLQEKQYDMHVLKHKTMDSFNKNVLKVVLIGNKATNKNEITNKLISTFSGMVCDYTFYKCAMCQVCIREFRNTIHHYCLIDAAKTKCPLCDLIFDEGKIKGHLKLHDTDPDITKDTIIVKDFGSKGINRGGHKEIINNKNEPNKNDVQEDELMVSKSGLDDRVKDKDDTSVTEITAKIYKCDCGLHFLNDTQIKEHFDKCSGIVRANKIRQDCFKCGLTFNSNVLFKHLLEHHGGKNVFKYEIVESTQKSVA